MRSPRLGTLNKFEDQKFNSEYTAKSNLPFLFHNRQGSFNCKKVDGQKVNFEYVTRKKRLLPFFNRRDEDVQLDFEYVTRSNNHRVEWKFV